MLAATGDLILLAALPFLVALDWATRQRRQFTIGPVSLAPIHQSYASDVADAEVQALCSF
jgi:hypothetical protein